MDLRLFWYLLLGVAGWFAFPIRALEVVVTQDEPGGELVATITHDGALLVGNDLKQQTEQLSVRGRLVHPLGKPALSGFYQFSFTPGGRGWETVTRLTFVEGGSLFTAGRSTAPVVALGAWGKFRKHLTTNNLRAALGRFDKGWMARNSVKMTETGTACFVVAAGVALTPEVPPAALVARQALPACVAGSSQLMTDAICEVFKAYALHLQSLNILTQVEAAEIVRAFDAIATGTSALADAGSAAASARLDGQKAAKVITNAFTAAAISAGASGVEAQIDTPKGRLTFRLFADAVSKGSFLLQFAPK